MIKITLEAEKPLTTSEIAKVRRDNPDLKFRIKNRDGKQYILMEIDDKDTNISRSSEDEEIC